MSDEQTLFKGSPSPVIKLGSFLICGLVLAASLVFSFLVPAPFTYMLWALAGLAILAFIFNWMLVKARVYEVTSERIRITNGLFTRRTDELELYRVKDATLIEPFVLRMLSLGDIEITTHDVSTPIVRLDAIRNARTLREELRKSIEACRDRKRVRMTELE